MKNIFVTGGSSYLGKNVLKGLPNFNYYSLESANNSSEGENIRIVDKTCLENLGKLFKDEKIEFVFHFASVYRKNQNTNDLLEMFDININDKTKDIMRTNDLYFSLDNKNFTNRYYKDNIDTIKDYIINAPELRNII